MHLIFLLKYTKLTFTQRQINDLRQLEKDLLSSSVRLQLPRGTNCRSTTQNHMEFYPTEKKIRPY